MVYEEILNNKDYLELVKNIENIKFINNGKWDWEHGLGHYIRVANYVKKILSQLNSGSRDIDLGMATALLHDIGLSKCDIDKIDHGIKGSKIFRNYIMNTNITEEESNVIEQSIIDHSNGNNISSLIGLALVLADKLDVTFHRTINLSIQDKMNKEIQKIRNVDIEINNNELIVKYTTTGDFDINILNDWEKAITVPKKAANYLNKNFIFIVNNKKIEV